MKLPNVDNVGTKAAGAIQSAYDKYGGASIPTSWFLGINSADVNKHRVEADLLSRPRQNLVLQSGYYLIIQRSILFSYLTKVRPSSWLNKASGVYESTGFITSFDVPQLGINWSNSSEQFYHAIPNLDINTFNVTFTPLISDFRNTLFYKAYDSLFTKRGTLAIRSKGVRYSMFLVMMPEDISAVTASVAAGYVVPASADVYGSFAKVLVAFDDVRLSYPKITPNMQSTELATYSITVAYDNLVIL